jgi:TonB family protein
MLLEKNPELEIPPKRGKTLIISVLVHVVLVAIIAFEPSLFDSSFRRVIRIQGNDADVRQLTELAMQPVPKPAPAPKVEESKPMTQPPPVKTPPPEAAPPPPPPPPPPPVHAISPDDILAPGAKPDGQVQASRGNSSEQQRQGGAAGDSTPQIARGAVPPPPSNPAGSATPPSVANTNPNALTVPNLLQQANRNADQAARALQRSGPSGGTMGPKTGRSNAPNGQNFSADGGVQILSDTKGYNFGDYMNQVLNKVRSNWSIPDLARFGARGRVIIDFTITKNGDIVDCHIISESGERSLDGAAKSAIDSSNPFQRLPAGFSGNELQLRFGFYYNIPVE